MHEIDRQLLQSFEDCSLDFREWTQRSHVAVASIYLGQYGFERALELLRDRIKAYNAHHGVEESELRGYNETTTVAMLTIIHAVMESYAGTLPTAHALEFCDAHPELMSKHILRLFYSPEQRRHPEAKFRFVEPDLAPLPVARH